MASRPDSARSRAAWSAADGDMQASSFGSGSEYTTYILLFIYQHLVYSSSKWQEAIGIIQRLQKLFDILHFWDVIKKFVVHSHQQWYSLTFDFSGYLFFVFSGHIYYCVCNLYNLSPVLAYI